jgi:hypothetical protein
MQLNAPRLRSQCVSSKSTSSDDPAPHASRSKFRPSNGSRHSSRQRQNVDIAAVVGAEGGRRGGRRREGVRRWCWRRRRRLEGRGEYGRTEGLDEINLRELGRLELGAHLEQLELKFRHLQDDAGGNQSTIRVQSECNQSAIRVQSECNQSAIREPSECNQRPSSRARVSSPPPTCGTSRALGRSPFRAARGVVGSRRPEWRRRPWWRAKQSPPPH